MKRWGNLPRQDRRGIDRVLLIYSRCLNTMFQSLDDPYKKALFVNLLMIISCTLYTGFVFIDANPIYDPDGTNATVMLSVGGAASCVLVILSIEMYRGRKLARGNS